MVYPFHIRTIQLETVFLKPLLQNGSITTTNYSYNNSNQMMATGDKTYYVSDNGNVTNDGVFQYAWNAFDQLTEIKF